MNEIKVELAISEAETPSGRITTVEATVKDPAWIMTVIDLTADELANLRERYIDRMCGDGNCDRPSESFISMPMIAVTGAAEQRRSLDAWAAVVTDKFAAAGVEVPADVKAEMEKYKFTPAPPAAGTAAPTTACAALVSDVECTGHSDCNGTGFCSPNSGHCKPYKTSKEYCNVVQLCANGYTCVDRLCVPECLRTV
jgi:hypothetical protein